MEITGLGWSGTRTDRADSLATFYRHVLGLRLVHTEPHFWVFELPDGNHVEVFGQQYPGKDHFTTALQRWSSPRRCRGGLSKSHAPDSPTDQAPQGRLSPRPTPHTV